MSRKITFSPSEKFDPMLEFGGWYDGKRSYLWIGLGDRTLGTIEGRKLLRFAKAVVREFEKESR